MIAVFNKYLSQQCEQIAIKTSEDKTLDKSISIIESIKLDSRWTIGLLWTNEHITAFAESSRSLNQTENCATFSPSGRPTQSYLHSFDWVVNQWISRAGKEWQQSFNDFMIKNWKKSCNLWKWRNLKICETFSSFQIRRLSETTCYLISAESRYFWKFKSR